MYPNTRIQTAKSSEDCEWVVGWRVLMHVGGCWLLVTSIQWRKIQSISTSLWASSCYWIDLPFVFRQAWIVALIRIMFSHPFFADFVFLFWLRSSICLFLTDRDICKSIINSTSRVVSILLSKMWFECTASLARCATGWHLLSFLCKLICVVLLFYCLYHHLVTKFLLLLFYMMRAETTDTLTLVFLFVCDMLEPASLATACSSCSYLLNRVLSIVL